MMDIALITAGQMYRYYLRQVVVGDGRRPPRTHLRKAQEEAGVPAGRWMGRGLAVLGLAAGVVVTMGCGDACSAFPGKRYLDWKLDDPAGQGIEAARPVRDEIEQRVSAELAPVTRAGPAGRQGACGFPTL